MVLSSRGLQQSWNCKHTPVTIGLFNGFPEVSRDLLLGEFCFKTGIMGMVKDRLFRGKERDDLLIWIFFIHLSSVRQTLDTQGCTVYDYGLLHFKAQSNVGLLWKVQGSINQTWLLKLQDRPHTAGFLGHSTALHVSALYSIYPEGSCDNLLLHHQETQRLHSISFGPRTFRIFEYVKPAEHNDSPDFIGSYQKWHFNINSLILNLFIAWKKLVLGNKETAAW